ncbi:hypothetical protein WDU94_000481 [Cyamophila willieti]
MKMRKEKEKKKKKTTKKKKNKNKDEERKQKKGRKKKKRRKEEEEKEKRRRRRKKKKEEEDEKKKKKKKNNLANTGGIQVTMDSMRTLPIISGAPWKIIFHGFRNSKEGVPNMELRKAYFTRGFYNILSGDVSKPIDDGPGNLCYPSAAKNVLPIGICFAQQLAMLIQAGVLPGPEQLHFVGHSLGAHIAGNTGSALRNLIGRPVYRITGLDPAGPLLWKRKTPDFKILDPKDATFVDAHHTNGGVFFAKGQTYQLGTVDIYYNGGREQPQLIEQSMVN